MGSKIRIIIALLLVVALAVPVLSPTPALADDTGWKKPTATGVLMQDEWTNPTNAYDETNDTYATVEGFGDDQGYSSFNFSIPGGSVIVGIEVQAEAKSCDAGCALEARLSWDGGSSDTSKKSVTLTTSDATYVLGSPTDTWGRNWSLGEFTNDNFAVEVQSDDPGTGCSSCTGSEVSLDEIRVKVYYCDAGTCTGWTNPSSNAADAGNGFEIAPDDAYANDTDEAENVDGTGDSHIYYNYGFSIPPGSTINGIEVRLDWWMSHTTGDKWLDVDLSWDGGVSNWTGQQRASTKRTSDGNPTDMVGGPCYTWNRTWDADDFSDANFRVRVECYSEYSSTDFYLDWVPVRVCYTEPAAPPEDLDFGDAPSPYPTLLPNGARHVIDNIYMGANIDAELDGQPSVGAVDDDTTGAPPNDEDGVTNFGPLTPGDTAATVDVNGGPSGGNLDAWIDFNADGDWGDAGEQIFNTQVLGVGANAGLTFPVPLDAQPDSTYARFRLSTIGGLLPTGLADDGEVEDYEVTIERLTDIFDYGDAPSPYPTMLPAGARHVSGDINMGSLIDTEGDGQADDGDDEDGVTLLGAGPPATSPGGPYTMPYRRWQNGAVEITVSGASGDGYLSGWIDWNQDDDWDEAGENVFCNRVVSVPGTYIIDFDSPVPGDALLGPTWARFRLSDDDTNNVPGGLADNGEVEDYEVEVGEAEYDFGDAPDLPYPTLLASTGASHMITTIWMGPYIDGEADGQPTANADGDDITGVLDDEDGVTLPALLTPGDPAATVDVDGGPSGGELDAWIDFNADGDWDDAGEQIFNSQVLAAGDNPLTFHVPLCTGMDSDFTYARFRLSTQGGLPPTGPADDGEVEDYRVEIDTTVQRPETQLAMILDGSGSIGTSWTIEVNGLAAAVEDPDCIPQDGTVELTVVQFGEFGGGAQLEVGPVVITSANAATVATDIGLISQVGGATPMACGICLAANVLRYHPEAQFAVANKQVLNLVTDGAPNVCCDCADCTDEWECTGTSCTGSPEENVETARGYALTTLEMTDDQDEFDAEFIGITDGPSDWLKDFIVWPPPGSYAPPFEPGWVRVVEDADEFAETICEKLAVVVVGEWPAPRPSEPRRPSEGVGGTVMPMDKVELLAPWIGLALVIVIGGGILVVRRRTTR